MQVHIILTNGTVINTTMAPDFDFPTWVRAVRSDGFIIGPNLYIQLHAIAAVVVPGDNQGIEIKPASAVLQ